jgi:hypothetical protein
MRADAKWHDGTSDYSRRRDFLLCDLQEVKPAGGGHNIVMVGMSQMADEERPVLNVEAVCRGIAQQASDPSEKGGPDLAFSQCIKSEQAIRQRLVEEWATFAPADKSNCVAAEMAALPSYTDLLTCLRMARDARRMK